VEKSAHRRKSQPVGRHLVRADRMRDNAAYVNSLNLR
jgi:hypothetical protein